MEGFQIGAVHPTSIVSKSAKLGKGVTIGAGTIVYDNVIIEDNVVIGPGCFIGEPLSSYYSDGAYQNPELRIGEGSIIRSHSCLYAGSTIGKKFECGNRITIREKTKIGEHTRIGTLCDIQGNLTIGHYVRLHSNVHIGRGAVISDFVWLFPYVVLTNDPHPPSEVMHGVTIEEFAVLATMAVILPGIRIGRDALVGAKALVRSDVPAEAVVVGAPAKQVTTIHSIKHVETGEPVYPWRESFDRGMPWERIGYRKWSEQCRQ